MSDEVRAVVSVLEERLDGSTARGLASAVSSAIRDETLLPGSKLPPIRTIAAELALSPTTVSAAWTLLQRARLIYADGRRGTVIAPPPALISGRYSKALKRRTDFELDLSTGVPDPLLLPSLRSVMDQITTVPMPTTYLDEPLLPELRETLLSQWPFQPEALMVSDGAMDALDQVTREVLGEGQRVIVEDPGFPLLVDLIESTGASVTAVPVDEEGLVVDGLRAALKTHAAAVFLQPRAHNPTGVSLSETRARELARELEPTSTLVVEDDSAAGLATAGAISLGRWLPQQTVHIRSFSKSLGPDLRLAAISTSDGIAQALMARRRLGQGWSSRILQRLVHALLTEPGSTTQVETARAEYAARRHQLTQALTERGVVVTPGDGINVWIEVTDETAALVSLASRGIGAAPGSPFKVLADSQHHLRVTCALVVPELVDHVADSIAEASLARPWGPLDR